MTNPSEIIHANNISNAGIKCHTNKIAADTTHQPKTFAFGFVANRGEVTNVFLRIHLANRRYCRCKCVHNNPRSRRYIICRRWLWFGCIVVVRDSRPRRRSGLTSMCCRDSPTKLGKLGRKMPEWKSRAANCTANCGKRCITCSLSNVSLTSDISGKLNCYLPQMSVWWLVTYEKSIACERWAWRTPGATRSLCARAKAGLAGSGQRKRPIQFGY